MPANPTSIDQYLLSKGSPLAGYGKAFVNAGRRHGVDPRLLVAIAGAESSFAKYKPSQAIFNAWGWGPHRKFPSWEAGIDAVARGLGENYISKGLKTIEQISGRYAPVGAANDPLNYNRNWTRNVSRFYQELGGRSVEQEPRRSGGFDRRAASLEGLRRLASGNYDPLEMLAELPSFATGDEGPPVKAKTTTSAAGKGVVDTSKPGKGTHVTSGLGWGTKTAVDIMAAPGTPVGAPTSGVVVRHGSAQGGQALYLQGDDGFLYWLGHIDGMAPVGTRVGRGQQLAVISADHKAPHVHIDRRKL